MEIKNKISNGVKILIATGIFPPDIGGAAYFADNLSKEFLRQGNAVKVVTYGIEKKLPIGIRHFVYFSKLLLNIPKADLVIALDTFSVGLPAVIAAKVFRKKIIIRVSGDFLWESYVERSGNLLIATEFYRTMPELSLKEKIVFSLTKFIFRNCSAIAFTTIWQKEIFKKPYNLDTGKIYIIENFYGKKILDYGFKDKNFLWAGRPIKLKNTDNLKAAFEKARKENSGINLDMSEKVPHEKLLEKIQTCYAVILPSLTDVSPNFIIDAVSANKPFILTKETGLHEKLKDIGVFIDSLDKNDIKKKIIFLADDRNYNEYKNKIITFNFNHSWEQIAEEYLTIYKHL